MMFNKLFFRTFVVLGSLSCLAAAAPGSIQVRALALTAQGTQAGDLTGKDWKVQLGGRNAEVTGVRSPAEMGNQPVKWVLVILPVQGPEARKLSVTAIGHFLETLPSIDQALIINHGTKGLECLTPGFTNRPSQWAKALERLVEEMTPNLQGNEAGSLALALSQPAEAPEGLEPLKAFLRRIEPIEFKRFPQDSKSTKSVVDEYSASPELGTFAGAVTRALDAIGGLAPALSRVDGDKQVVVFSRNEIDDLGSPLWRKYQPRRQRGGGGDPRMDNKGLQVQMMTTDVTLAQERVRNAFALAGIPLHSVSSASPSYSGGLGEVAFTTGGHCFHFTPELIQGLPQILGLWAQRYELTVTCAPGRRDPGKLEIETSRKDLKIIAASFR